VQFRDHCYHWTKESGAVDTMMQAIIYYYWKLPQNWQQLLSMYMGRGGLLLIPLSSFFALHGFMALHYLDK
jgi:hypothetical protein